MIKWIPSLSSWSVVVCICLGATLGAGGYTFHYAEGASYLSNDPASCTNCHVMQPYFDGWQKGSHHHVAVCNDCHVPHETLAGKYLAKADAGFRHSWAFTFEDFHEPIQMIDRSEAILEQNCVRCHGEVVNHQLELGMTDCTHCHQSVGHGPTF